MVELTTKQKAAVLTVLQRIGSWTAARWDQHLRHDVGDEDTDVILQWAYEQLGPGSMLATDARIAAAAREYVAAVERADADNQHDVTPYDSVDEWRALVAAVRGEK